MKARKTLKIMFLLSTAFAMGAALIVGYPYAKHFFSDYHVPYYIYNPERPIEPIDTSLIPPAKAVPILMYHGVMQKTDTENTDQKHFVAQMEMLKREGYQTISLVDLDKFLDGKTVLPPKPIIITFDDGRKDSYYPTDDIFKKLGFKAVLFEVSGKANDAEKFYLSWDDLKTMQASGRWEIEAHGTYSHEHILAGSNGEEGRFLSSKKWLGNRLETDVEFKKRVKDDYEINLTDLKNQLGIVSKYYAIPLNDYGYNVYSNYPESATYNRQLIEKYFRLAFSQANDSDNVYRYSKGIYNYADADRWNITRIEVKNMEAEALKRRLDEERPQAPALYVHASDTAKFSEQLRSGFGQIEFDSLGLHLKPTDEYDSVWAVYGDYHWKDYTVEADIKRLSGQSVALLSYLKDDFNYVAFGISGNYVFLREYTKGDYRDLRESITIPVAQANAKNNFKLIYKGNLVDAYLNGKLIFKNAVITISRGATGLKVWDPKHKGEGVMEGLQIKSQREN